MWQEVMLINVLTKCKGKQIKEENFGEGVMDQ
jgi:hypothetical protein